MPTIIREGSSEFKKGITKKIVVAHLKEHKNYYSKLKKAGIE